MNFPIHEYTGWITLVVALFAIGAVGTQSYLLIRKRVDDRVRTLSDMIHDCTMRFLREETMRIVVVVGIVALLIYFKLGLLSAIAYVLASFVGLVSMWLAMKVGTRSNGRVATAAKRNGGHGLDKAFKVAIRGGSILGWSVAAGVMILGSVAVFLILNGWGVPENFLPCLSAGLSTIAIFARVGGGILTKAGDVAADYVGKGEFQLKEDDHRNPAVVIDNVGDNVGDIGGMGTDLKESWFAAIVAAMLLAEPDTYQVYLPLLVTAAGIMSAPVGFALFRWVHLDNDDEESRIHRIMNASLLMTAVPFLGVISALFWYYGEPVLIVSVLSGMVAGITMGFIAQYFTAARPVHLVVDAARQGSAAGLIMGFGIGLASVLPSVVVLAGAVILSYEMGGMYGIALSAVGMMGLLPQQLTFDGFGPICDNAGGLAAQAELDPEVRRRTDLLDAVGNTTAAEGKGFAIGSAALTALSLFVTVAHHAGIESANVWEPMVFGGGLVGLGIPTAFAAYLMYAVGKAANSLIKDSRNQIRQAMDADGNIDGSKIDHESCIASAVRDALRHMVPPIAFTMVMAVFAAMVNPLFGLGLLLGAMFAAITLAIFMANAGGVWDNAKKYIETNEEKLLEQLIEEHGDEENAEEIAKEELRQWKFAAIVGDMVGDPFKDTAGPAMDILVKLLATLFLLFIGGGF